MKKIKKLYNPVFQIASHSWMCDILSYKKINTYKAGKGVVKELNEEFGNYKILSITKRHIQEYASKVSQRLAPATVRERLRILREIMEYADEDWTMPRIKVPKRKTPILRRYYSFEEMRKIINQAYGKDKVILMILAETGARIGEVLALQSDDIHEDYISITKTLVGNFIQDSPKTISSIRDVLISKTLREVIEPLRNSPKTHLFREALGVTNEETIRYRFLKYCERAKIEPRGFHAFRRGNVTELSINLGIPEKVIGYRIGHEVKQSLTLGVYCQAPKWCDRPYIERIEKALYDIPIEHKFEAHNLDNSSSTETSGLDSGVDSRYTNDIVDVKT